MTVAIANYARRISGFGRNAKLYLACTMLRSMAMGFSSLLFNLYLVSMGFDVSFVGLCATLLSVGSITSSLPAGLIADRIGRKRAMVIGQVGIIFAQSGAALSRQAWMIAGSNLLFGAVGALFTTSVAPFLTENSTKQERSILFTLNYSLMNVAQFLVMVVGGYLPRLFAALLRVGPESAPAYRGVLLTSTFLMALALVPILTLKDQRRAARTSRRLSRHVWRWFTHPRLVAQMILPQVIVAFGAGLVFPFINLFYKERFGVSDATLGWILGVTSITAAMVMVVGGSIAERIGKIQALFVSRSISVPLLVIIGFAPTLPVVVAAHWTRSGFMRIGDPLYLAFAMEQLPEEERATGASLLTLGWETGWGAGPYVSGLVQTRTGFGPLFAGTTACYLLSLFFVYLFFIRGQNRRLALWPARPKTG
jgi:MFS family permease